MRVKITGFKASETLLGIETQAIPYTQIADIRFKASETLLGIETWEWSGVEEGWEDSKPLKPF